MIRLATVFSGIGAIEHALDRMGIDHQIVFACDNGDVDILNKDVGMNIDDILSELSVLNEKISSLNIDESVDDLYKQQLLGMFKQSQSEYSSIIETIEKLPGSPKALKDF